MGTISNSILNSIWACVPMCALFFIMGQQNSILSNSFWLVFEISILVFLDYLFPSFAILTMSRKLSVEERIHCVLMMSSCKPKKIIDTWNDSKMVQKLELRDYSQRIQFCERMLCIFDQNPFVFNQIIWTDEVTFNLSDQINRHNSS